MLKQILTLTIGGNDRVATIGSELSGGLGGGWWMAVTLTIGGGDVDDSQVGGDQSELET